jgi:hypothetical protein
MPYLERIHDRGIHAYQDARVVREWLDQNLGSGESLRDEAISVFGCYRQGSEVKFLVGHSSLFV